MPETQKYLSIIVKALVGCGLLFYSVIFAQDYLNEEEKQWLNHHKVIIYSPDPDFHPFEFVSKDGSVQGITPDILKIISQKLNISISNVTYQSWSEVLNGLKHGEIDLVGTITKTKERESYFDFTSPYLNVPVALFIHRDNPHFASLENLKGRRVGVVKNYGAEHWLRTNHPEFEIITVSSPREGLLMLAFKRLDAFVEVLPVGSYFIYEYSLTDIVHSKEPLYLTPQHFAVLKSNSVLLGIMEKGVQSLTESEKMEVFNKWTKQNPVKERLPIYLIAILFGVILVSAGIIYLLNKIIAIRTAQLKHSEEVFKNIFQNNPLMSCITTIEEGRIIDVNKKFEEYLGFNKDEIIGRATTEFGLWVNPEQRAELIEKVKQNGFVHNYQTRIKTRDGKELSVLYSMQILKQGNDEFVLSIINDITDLVSATIVKNRLAEIIESTSALVLTATTDLKVSYINKAGIKMLGLENKANLNELTMFDIFPEKTKEFIVSNAIPSAIRNGIWEGETSINTFDGRTIPCIALLIAHKNPEGKLSHISVVVRDISEIKAAQENLIKSEEKFRHIIENSSQLFYIHDTDNKIIYISPQIKEFLDINPEELDKLDWTGFLSDNPINQIGIELTELAIRTGERQKPYELEFVDKNGERIWMLVSESPTVVNGKTTAITGSLTNITERKKLEETLRKRESFIEAITRSSPDLIIVFNIQEQKYIYTNKNPAKILGYDNIEHLEFDEFLKYVHPEDLEKIKQHFEQLKKAPDNTVLSIQYRIRHKSGEYLTFFTRGFVFERDANGNVKFIFSTHQDITEVKKTEIERQRLETQMRQMQKMEAIGKLAGGVAHDFNNILTVIDGCVDMVLGSYNIDDEAQSLLMDIKKASKRASDLTKQLLMFSRQQVMELKPLEINQIVKDLTKMLKRLIGEHISIVLNLKDGLPLISGDQSMIEALLINLVINARDAMPSGGTITISTGLKDIETEFINNNQETYHGRFISISVSDTGTGIEKNLLGKIFEPFFTTKELGQGTGLGLSVVFGIAKQHGGWVDVESEPGKGATFTIFIPVLEKTPQILTDAEEKVPLELCGHETILVVEDDEHVRQIAVTILRRFGYEVIEARNGLQALNLWNELGNKIDLVFTDVVMPGGIDGFELAEKLKQKNPNIKIIFTSGYSGELVHIQADLMSMGAFIRKPFNPIRLVKLIRKTLDTPGW
ncbi:MAG TPA: PAS domain S-box protein [Verrucomicrobiota bacterium]|nr:PAS domain S-box protein [Verrucomicrobiota bacterium]